MRNIDKRIISTLLAFIFLFYLFSLLDLQIFRYTVKLLWRQMILIALIMLIIQFLRFLRNYFVLKKMDELKLSFFRFLPHALIANTISTYGPLKSGEIGVIQIYDAQFSCPPQASMAVIIVGRAMDISIVIILSLFTIFLVNNEKLSSIILILIFIIIFVLMLFLFLLNRSFGMIIMDNIGKIRVLSKLSDRLIVFASEYYDNLTLILKNKGVKWYLLIFTFSRWIIEFFMNYYLYLIMSIDIKIFELFAIIGLSYAIGVSSGTPGAVGISQFTSLAIMIYALGIPAELAIITVSIGLSLGIIVNLLLISIGISLSFIIKVNL